MTKKIILLISSYFILFLSTLGLGYGIFKNTKPDNITNIDIENVKYNSSDKAARILVNTELEILDINNYAKIVSNEFLVIVNVKSNSKEISDSWFNNCTYFKYANKKWHLYLYSNISPTNGYVRYTIIWDNRRGLWYESNELSFYF